MLAGTIIICGRARSDGSPFSCRHGRAVLPRSLDALDPGERRAVQEAAVFGQVFWLSALSRLSGLEQVELERTVGRITRAGFIVPRPASTITGEREFAFSHGLTAEVAYSQMVRSRRARLHADAGAWLEEAAAGHEQMTEPIAMRRRARN